MATKSADHWSTGLPRLKLKWDISGPMQAVGALFAMSADAVKFLFRRPFQVREFIEQFWFIASVTVLPAALVAIPFGAVIALRRGEHTAVAQPRSRPVAAHLAAGR